MSSENVVSQQEFGTLTASVKSIIDKKLAPLPREELISLVLIASSIIGNDIMNKKEPSSTHSALSNLNNGLSFIFTKNEQAKTDLGIQAPANSFH